MYFIKKFTKDTSGAVTVDWVVLASVVIGLGLAVVTTLAPGATNVGSNTAESLLSISDRVSDGTVLD